MRVLAVDDDPIALEHLSFTLDQLGIDFTAVRNSQEALSLAASGSYQVVISDWEMDSLDGPSFCREVRKIGLPSYVYFLLLTVRQRSGNVVEALDAGVDDIMSKPLDPNELIGRLRAAERVLSLQTRDLTIFVLAKLAESRDPETGAHLDRVRSYAKCIAEHLRSQNTFGNQIDPTFVRLIYETAPLHDIGKVAIPDNVLLKPGKLTPDEMEIMKRHTLVGAETLAAALEQSPRTAYLQIARDIARSHHERWDGTGYPDGLRGDAIPLSARIVSVADVYDALSTARVYKPAFGHAQAKEIIVNGSGSQFDSRVVEAFLAQEQRVLEIRAKYGEPAERSKAA